MAKSRDAFRTISEVAEWLDTPAHVLRFWESKFTQVKPVKRAGGRRYYRPDDMALLAGIKTLLHEQGLTIKGAQKLLREKGVKHVAALGADPRQAEGKSGADVIELRPVETEHRAPDPTPSEPGPDVQTPEAPQRVEPTAWDPDDPWPADPVPTGNDGPALSPLDETATTSVFSSSEPEPDAGEPDAHPEPPVAAPSEEPDDFALPFVHNRAPQADAPADPPTAEAPTDHADEEVDEGPTWQPPPPPALPDIDAITGASGAITLVAASSRADLRRKAARIAPIVRRMAELRDRMAAQDG